MSSEDCAANAGGECKSDGSKAYVQLRCCFNYQSRLAREKAQHYLQERRPTQRFLCLVLGVLLVMLGVLGRFAEVENGC